MKNPRFLVMAAVLVFASFTAGIASGALVAQELTYQGKLTDTAGNPLTGTYSVTFSLYEGSTGGTALASSVRSVSCTGGLFTTQIPFSQQYFDGRALWLGIKVGSDPEMTPRQELTPVAYTLGLRPWITGASFTTNRAGTGSSDKVPGINISTISSWNPGIIINTTGSSGYGIDISTKGNYGIGLYARTYGAHSGPVQGYAFGPDSKGILGYSISGNGVFGESVSTTGIFGTSGDGIGVHGSGAKDTGVKGTGITGVNGTGTQVGVRGIGVTGVTGISTDTAMFGNTGVFGNGRDYGVRGTSDTGIGVTGISESGSGVFGTSTSNDGILGTSDSGAGLHGESSSGYGVLGVSTSADGIHGTSTSSAGVNGTSITKEGIVGISTSGRGVYGRSTSAPGVFGTSTSMDGVTGGSTNLYGVSGYSTNSIGVYGHSNSQAGVKGDGTVGLAGTAGSGGTGLIASAPSDGTGKAAIFNGNVVVRNFAGTTDLMEFGEGLDYSEGFDITGREAVTPGTVLVISPDDSGSLTISSEPYDRKVAGIVAGANGLGSAVRVGGDQFDTSVALAGRVYCNVDATYGAVHAGDQLTTSATPGYAMAVQDYAKAQGATIGKAMQGLEQGQKGQILVLVTLQ